MFVAVCDVHPLGGAHTLGGDVLPDSVFLWINALLWSIPLDLTRNNKMKRRQRYFTNANIPMILILPNGLLLCRNNWFFYGSHWPARWCSRRSLKRREMERRIWDECLRSGSPTPELGHSRTYLQDSEIKASIWCKIHFRNFSNSHVCPEACMRFMAQECLAPPFS